MAESVRTLEGAVQTVVRRASEWLGVRPDEVRALAAACAFQFSFVAGVAMLKSASNALLVGTQSLPVLYVASALATGGYAAFEAVLRPQRRWPPTTAYTLWCVGLVGLAALVQAGVGVAVEGLYLAAEVYATTMSVRFWAQVGDIFDVRRARQMLGLIGGIGMAGSIVGGALTRSLGEALGPLRLVPASCLAIVVCLMVAPKLKRPVGSRPSMLPVSAKVLTGPPKGAREYLLTDGLPRTMAFVAAFAAAITALADYLFRVRAKELFSSAEQAALFGGQSALVGVVAMVVQLGLTNVLLKRVGLFAYLALVPTMCLVFAGVALATPSLWPVYTLKVIEQVGALSLTQTGMQLLYGPMPDTVRSAARSAIDGFSKKIGYALAGIGLFIFTARLAHGPWLALAVVATGLLALAAIARVRVHYIQAIGERLNANTSETQDISLSDVTARRVLEQAIGSENEGRVLTSLELLARDRGAKLEPHLVKLLDHPSAKVRREAARLAGERGTQGAAVRLAQLALNDEPRVRETAIFAVAQVRPFTAGRLLAPLLEHPDLSTRAAAISALVPIDPGGQAGRALEELLERGGQALPVERAQVARLLGRIGAGPHGRRISEYLRDPTPSVRIAACEAAGDCTELALVDELWRQLVARETRTAARQALTRYGDRIATRIEALLNDRTIPTDLRYRLPRLLRDIGTRRALEVILFSNTTDDPFLQYRLSVAAARIREAHPDVECDAARVLAAIHRRLDRYSACYPVFRDLEAALGPGNLLVRALCDRLDQHLESALRLSGLVYPQRQVTNAYTRFIHGDAKTRPYAIEMLEHTIDDGALARRVVKILESWHRKADWNDEGRMERGAERLLELVESEDVVLRAVTIATVRRLAVARQEVADTTAPVGTGSGIHALARVARGPAWEAFWASPPVIREEGPVSERIVEKVLFLEGVDIFAESDVDDLAAVAQYLKERTYTKGETIYVENDPGDALFVIVEGRVRIEKERKHILDLGPRDSFGETSLLDNKPRPATAKAIDEVKVLVLERADFMDLVSDRVELLRGIFGAITKHLRSVLDAAAAGRITSPGMTPVSMPKLRQKTG